ncbi:MAG: LysE family translocator [Marivivens sp.]|uniref:LysE family translocator n=1 Tax=Marivivens sp. TaxID=1978374 RepID=UPI00180B7427|nr:LysE family translocator [Marivivens sp.]NVJ94497.1 LysE family translocator [Marivivens sp.]
MDLTQSIIQFALASFLIELTPGPNMAYLAVVAACEGRRYGFAAVAGVALGLALVGIAAALGVGAMINASPVLYQTLRWGGVVYLLWLAYDGWRDSDEEIEHAALGSPLLMFFRRGLITNLLNPKAAVFYIAVLPGFVVDGAAVMPQTITLSVVYVVVATAIHAAIVGLAGTAQTLLENPRKRLVLRRVLSAALALVAFWFAWKTQG